MIVVWFKTHETWTGVAVRKVYWEGAWWWANFKVPKGALKASDLPSDVKKRVVQLALEAKDWHYSK